MEKIIPPSDSQSIISTIAIGQSYFVDWEKLPNHYGIDTAKGIG